MRAGLGADFVDWYCALKRMGEIDMLPQSDKKDDEDSKGWKFLGCSHCQALCQQASWLLIGCIRVNNHLEARAASCMT